jgi:hypothetical protein
MAIYQSLGRLVQLVFGDAYYAPLNDTLDHHAGYPITPVSRISLGSPVVADVDWIVTTQAIVDAAVTPLVIAHATLDVPRNITAVGASGADAILDIVGTDLYGNVLTETLTLNADTPVETAQAFKTVTSITPEGGAGKGATAMTVGVGNKLGFPVKLNARSDLLHAFHGATEDGGGTTVVVGSVDAGADDRGTIAFTNALDGSEIVVWMAVDTSTKLKMVGVA